MSTFQFRPPKLSEVVYEESGGGGKKIRTAK
jgi:hypothetical protein